MDNLWREVYYTCEGKIKVLEVYNINFGFSISYFFHYYLFNSLYFDMAIRPLFKVQNFTLINVKYNGKELIKWMKS